MLKAIIFDFDGVLADTEPLHFRMFQQVLQGEGLPLSEHDYYEKYIGFDDRGCFHAVLSEHGRDAAPETIHRLVERKAAVMLGHLTTTRMVYPGAVEFVKNVAGRYRRAIVSGALRHEIEMILTTAGMRDDFEHITAAEDVQDGKPEPEGYLHALQALNRRAPILASECLVIEDTFFGIQAAHAAGMRCLALSTTSPPDRLRTADAVTATLQDCDLASLVRRLWT
ncbi:MAG: HAD family phosphatase [Nitrospirales bacterium]|nr:HAD family phosphatase [Nitrospirales bacterium]